MYTFKSALIFKKHIYLGKGISQSHDVLLHDLKIDPFNRRRNYVIVELVPHFNVGWETDIENWQFSVVSKNNPKWFCEENAKQRLVSEVKKMSIDQIHSEVLNDNGLAIKHIANPTESQKKLAVTKNGCAIQFIPNPTKMMKLIAINQNAYAVEFINDLTHEMKLEVVRCNANSISCFENPNEELQLASVNIQGNAIGNIENPTEAVKWAAIKNDCYAIHSIKNPSRELRIAAGEGNGIRPNPYL